MKRVFCFLFVLLFAQGISLAKEPSFYEEFDQQEELTKQEEKKNTALPNGAEKQNTLEMQGGVQSEAQGEFFLTDEKHARFLQENEQYALADSMLNQTWKILTKTLTKKEYRKLWQKHKKWLDSGRNSVADSFKNKVPAIPEAHAFMLATVAKTQELAQSVWHEPILGRYVKDDVSVMLVKEEGKIFLQGYGNVPFLAKNTDTAAVDTVKDTAKDEKTEETKNFQKKSADDPEKTVQPETGNITQTDAKKEDSPEYMAENQAVKQPEKNILKTMPQLLFRAELPQGKLWLALTTVNEQKLYLLTTQNSLCIVHAPNTFSFDFNGIFVKK